MRWENRHFIMNISSQKGQEGKVEEETWRESEKDIAR